jgi:hypothetical protein
MIVSYEKNTTLIAEKREESRRQFESYRHICLPIARMYGIYRTVYQKKRNGNGIN